MSAEKPCVEMCARGRVDRWAKRAVPVARMPAMCRHRWAGGDHLAPWSHELERDRNRERLCVKRCVGQRIVTSRIGAAVQRQPWGDRCTACESGPATPCGRRQAGRRGDCGMLSNRALELRSISASRRTTVKGMPRGISDVPAAYRHATAASNRRPLVRDNEPRPSGECQVDAPRAAAVKARSTAETRCRSASDEALTAASTVPQSPA